MRKETFTTNATEQKVRNWCLVEIPTSFVSCLPFYFTEDKRKQLLKAKGCFETSDSFPTRPDLQ